MITSSHGQPNLASSSTNQYGEQTHTMYGKSPTPFLICIISFFLVLCLVLTFPGLILFLKSSRFSSHNNYCISSPFAFQSQPQSPSSTHILVPPSTHTPLNPHSPQPRPHRPSRVGSMLAQVMLPPAPSSIHSTRHPFTWPVQLPHSNRCTPP